MAKEDPYWIEYRFTANEMAKEADLMFQYQLRKILRSSTDVPAEVKIGILQYEIDEIKKESQP